MKIVILTNDAVGLYQFRRELVTELIQSNRIWISEPYGKLTDPFIEMGCGFIDTPIDRRGVNPIKDLDLLWRYFKILKQIKPDLVITYTIKPNVYGGMICRLLRIPYAVNITGLGTAFQKKGPLKAFVTILYKLGLGNAGTVFFENRENRRIFVRSHIVKKKQCCLLNGAGVNLEHHAYVPYPEDIEETRFLFMGRVMKEKGIDELFEAMRRLKKEGFLSSLDVLGGYEDDYKEVIEACEKEGWLHYHGYQKDVRPYIANAHCFVLPSWHEGMANTNLECASTGRPVITSNIHGCKEAVVDGVTGFLCESKNADSLYETMKAFIMLNAEERRVMGLRGRKHMETHFDKNVIVKRTVERLMK